MIADDIQHGAVGKSLFVVTEPGRGVDAGEDGCLSGRALRTTFNTQTRVGWNNDAVENSCRFFIPENRKWLDIFQTVEGIEWPP